MREELLLRASAWLFVASGLASLVVMALPALLRVSLLPFEVYMLALYLLRAYSILGASSMLLLALTYRALRRRLMLVGSLLLLSGFVLLGITVSPSSPAILALLISGFITLALDSLSLADELMLREFSVVALVLAFLPPIGQIAYGLAVSRHRTKILALGAVR